MPPLTEGCFGVTEGKLSERENERRRKPEEKTKEVGKKRVRWRRLRKTEKVRATGRRWFEGGGLVCSRLKRSMSAPEAETGKQDQRVARATCMTHIVLKPHS